MNLPAITALVEATAGMILLTTPEDVTRAPDNYFFYGVNVHSSLRVRG